MHRKAFGRGIGRAGSGSDLHFRKIVFQAILPELKAHGMTTIVVSHDDRYFHIADRVVKLKQSELGESENPVGAVSGRLVFA
jgi:ABC-type siderophore export system fused ATPase/permease subunit